MPDVSVIIINYKTPELLLQCIDSLYKYEDSSQFEIIVLDNDSQDNSVSLVRKKYPDIILIEAPANFGFAKGNNIAVKASTSAYLFFLNSDTILTAPVLAQLIANLKSSPAASLVAPRLLNEDKSVQASVFKFPTVMRAVFESLFLVSIFPASTLFGDYRNFDYKKPMAVDYVSGACFLMQKSLFEQVNGFDESFFMYAEEADMMLRLAKLGYQCYYHPVGDIIHLGGASSGKKDAFKAIFFESQVRFFKKHYGAIGLKLFLFFKIIGYLLRNCALIPLGKLEKAKFNHEIIKFYARKFI